MDDAPEGTGVSAPGSGDGPPPVVRAAIAGGLVLGLVVVVALAGFILRGGPSDDDALDLQSVPTATILTTTTVDEVADEIEITGDASVSTVDVDTADTPSTLGPVVTDGSATTVVAPVTTRPPRPTTTTTTTTLPPEPLPPLPNGPYPTSAPADRCSAAAIAESLATAPDGGDTGDEVVAESEPRCLGPWAVIAIAEESCAADRRDAEGRCTEVQIVRWGGEGWIDRGLADSSCFDSVTRSGMSQAVNRELFGDNGACNVRFSYRREPSEGDLSIGDYGLRVAQLQLRLAEAGVFTDTVDGYFGRNTRAGVIDFQRFVEIDADGVVGSPTFVALGLPVR